MRLSAPLPLAAALAAGAAASADPRSLPQHHHAHLRHERRHAVGAGKVADTVANVTADGTAQERLAKRGGYNGRASFFAPGVGACGGTSSASDMIVALNSGQYGDGCDGVSPWCFQEIQISYGDKTEYAKVTDCCPGCPYGGLDMSPALFDKFADPSVGTFYMVWSGAGDGGSDSGSSGQSSTSKWVAPTTTTSYSHSSTSSSSSVSSSSTTSSSSSSAAATTTTAGPPPVPSSWSLAGGNLDRVNQVVMALGNLVAQVAVQAAPSSH